MKRRRHIFDDWPLPWFVTTDYECKTGRIYDHLGHCIFRNPTEDEPHAALEMPFEVAKTIADYANEYAYLDYNRTVEFDGEDDEYIYFRLHKGEETPVMKFTKDKPTMMHWIADALRTYQPEDGD